MDVRIKQRIRTPARGQALRRRLVDQPLQAAKEDHVVHFRNGAFIFIFTFTAVVDPSLQPSVDAVCGHTDTSMSDSIGTGGCSMQRPKTPSG
jgi:hypothetical protein